MLVGHDYKYAVEQIMLALFPGEKPIYSDADIIRSCELVAESSLRSGSFYAQAQTLMRCNDRVSRGVARIRRDKLVGKIVTDRLLQRIVKQSFYRAASRLFAPASEEGDLPQDGSASLDVGSFSNRGAFPPVWGSLTGIRPAKIAAAALEPGASPKSVATRLAREFFVSPERAAMCIGAAQASLALKGSLAPRDIALYVGIPFCPTRCAYCSFVSNSVEKSFGLVEPFVDVLLSEIETAARAIRELGLQVISIYIGGGTPTALPDQALEAVMQRIHASLELSGVREYTVEAGRPDTITAKKLDILARFGAGRICVNPQSMSGEVLSAIGRKHSPEDTIEAVRLVREAQTQNHPAIRALNIDVIAGLPADTPDGFARTLDTVLGFAPENITVHTLSLKKGSRIMLEGTAIPSGADVAKMLEYAALRLSESGFRPYYLYRQKYTSGGFENTGWSLPGYECIYNMCMMEELCTVLALGGGGVTKLVSPGGSASDGSASDGSTSCKIERIFNAKYPREYILQADKIGEKFERVKAHFIR